MKWKAEAYAFKDKSQLPGPRCIASQHFSTKIYYFCLDLNTTYAAKNYSSSVIPCYKGFVKINTGRN